MREWIESLPLIGAIVFFWCVGILRTSIVYALGSLAATGGSRLIRFKALFAQPLYQRAQAFVHRWGVLAVPACFFTVGFQTAVIITTGFMQMPLHRWIPAMLVGTLCWGIIYGTVGMAVIWAWLENPGVTALLIALALLLIFLMHRASSWHTRRK